MIWAAVLFGMVLPVSTAGADTGEDFWGWAPTPPMGWNSWDCFGCTVTEAEVKANADYMAEHLKEYGWEYIVVDIQWYEPQSNKKQWVYGYPPEPQTNIDEYGRPWPAVSKYPSSANGRGFKSLADYIHSKGLKFGVHLMRGIPRRAVEENTKVMGTEYRAEDIADVTSTCEWNPDMYGVDMSKPGAQAYYDSVFRLLAEWEIDFVKVDDLSRPYHREEVEAIRKAIDNCGREMVFSTSPGATPLEAGEHVSRHANMWRISDDFWDRWFALKSQFKRLHDWTPWRGDGHYPDADMLPLGKVRAVEDGWTNFTRDEQITMMTLWSIARSPLMMGGHMPKNDAFTLSLLTNPEVLAVNQQSSNNRQLFRKEGLIAWVADDAGSNDLYLALFNAYDGPELKPCEAVWKSPVISQNSAEKTASVDISIDGARKLILLVTDTGDGIFFDHADWLRPRIITDDGGIIKLTELKWVYEDTSWGRTRANRSILGRPLMVDGKMYEYGIGTHSISRIEYELPEGGERFKAIAALDDGATSEEHGGATIQFMVFTQDSITAVPEASDVAVSLKELDIEGKCKIRDLWKREDVGEFEDSFTARIRRHGAGLYRVSMTNGAK